jgi:hypothetical protein
MGERRRTVGSRKLEAKRRKRGAEIARGQPAQVQNGQHLGHLGRTPLSGCPLGTRLPGSTIINITRCRRSSPRIRRFLHQSQLATQTNYITMKFKRLSTAC